LFWDQEDIIRIDYLPKGQTINAEYYSSLLVQLKDILKEKRRGKVAKGDLFLHDNAPAHRALSTLNKLAYLGFHCFDLPTYSPDLAPSDYHLFPGLEKQLKGRHFFFRGGGHCCRGDLVRRTTFWIFVSGLQKIEQQTKNCIELRGEYFELIPCLVTISCFLPGRAKDLSALPPNCQSASSMHYSEFV